MSEGRETASQDHPKQGQGTGIEASKAGAPGNRPLVDAYEDYTGCERGKFAECSYADMEGGAAWKGFAEFRHAWHARLAGNTDLIEDLRSVMRWEHERMGAVSAGVLREVIARLQAGEE